MTIDELARRAGTTSRNVRALQTLGLVPYPSRRGRAGEYGVEHLDRLRSVLALQDQGFSLSALGALFRAYESGLSLDEVLGLPKLSPRTRHNRTEHDFKEPDPFEDWPSKKLTRPLAVVPTTVLDTRAS